MAEPKSILMMTLYDAAKGPNQHASKMCEENETIGQVLAETFPGADKGRSYVTTEPDMLLHILKRMQAGPNVTKGELTMSEFLIKFIKACPDVTESPSALDVSTQNAHGMIVVYADGKVLVSSVATVKPIQASSDLYPAALGECVSPLFNVNFLFASLCT
jgi:hypothetical protein